MSNFFGTELHLCLLFITQTNNSVTLVVRAGFFYGDNEKINHQDGYRLRRRRHWPERVNYPLAHEHVGTDHVPVPTARFESQDRTTRF